ncbi:MAG: DUF2066 domain-containing protein [Pseudomonadota bacterium]
MRRKFEARARAAGPRGPGQTRRRHATGMWLFGAVFFACVLWSVTARAAPVSGLYEAEALLADTSEPARADAELRALETVLIKLTGDSSINVLEVMALYDRGVSDLVRDSRQQLSAGGASRQLWVQFDRRQLDNLLQLAQVSRWGAERPLGTVILAVDDGRGAEILAAADASGRAATIMAAARRRAIPLVLPLMDLTDQRSVDPARADTGPADQLGQIRRRYRGEALIFGSLRRTGQDWTARWTLDAPGGAQRWEQRGQPVWLLETLVDRVADVLGSRFRDNAPAPRVAGSDPAPSPFQTQPPVTRDRPATPTAPRAPAGGAAAVSGVGTAPRTVTPVSPVNVPQRTGPAQLHAGGLHPSDGLAVTVNGVYGVRGYGRLLAHLRELPGVDDVVVTGVAGRQVGVVLRGSGGRLVVSESLAADFLLQLDPVSGAGHYRFQP